MPLYELHNIAYSYSGLEVLRIDHWNVASDTVTGVVGPNGSGKSTLLALLGFLEKPTRGHIRFNGQPAEPFADGVRGKVAMLAQDAFLLKRSVYGNIAYGLKIRKNKGDVRQRVHAAMAMVGLDPGAFAQRPWFALSGGEARRVALAARLVLRPQVLLMDEPTTSVDAASAQMIKEAALHARQQWGTTLVVASHDVEWLADMCDHMLHLFRGRIMGSGQHTLIFGPWRATNSGGAARSLTAHQEFVAAPVPENMESAVAALPAERAHLVLDPTAIPDGYHRIEGLLLRLSFEKATRRVNAAILVGSTLLTVSLPENERSACRHHPGQTVWVGYDPMSIGWF
jgi:tungstate transport system ATP-binding protein